MVLSCTGLTVISSQPKWKDSILTSPDSVDVEEVEMGPSQLLGVFFWDHNPETSEAGPSGIPPFLAAHNKHPVRWVLCVANTSATT